MGTIINIFCMKINSVSSNGSVNIGEALHNSHTANTKAQGGNTSFGDTSPTQSNMKNVYVDPDMYDQTETANNENIYSKQA